MKFKNKIIFRNECLFLCSCLILSVYAARPFSSGSGRTSLSSGSNLPRSSIGQSPSSFGTSSTSIGGFSGSAGFSSQNLNAPSKSLNTQFTSISDGKKALQTGSNTYIRQPAYNPFYNPSANTPSFSTSSFNTGNSQLKQPLLNTAVNGLVRQPAYNTYFNSSANTPFFSTFSSNIGNPQIKQPFLFYPTPGNGLKSHMQDLHNSISRSMTPSHPHSQSFFGLKGFSRPTIQNHHFLKSLHVFKTSNKGQPNKANIQMVIIGVVLSIIFIIAMYPLLLKCTKQYYNRSAFSTGYTIHM